MDANEEAKFQEMLQIQREAESINKMFDAGTQAKLELIGFKLASDVFYPIENLQVKEMFEKTFSELQEDERDRWITEYIYYRICAVYICLYRWFGEKPVSVVIKKGFFGKVNDTFEKLNNDDGLTFSTQNLIKRMDVYAQIYDSWKGKNVNDVMEADAILKVVTKLANIELPVFQGNIIDFIYGNNIWQVENLVPLFEEAKKFSGNGFSFMKYAFIFALIAIVLYKFIN